MPEKSVAEQAHEDKMKVYNEAHRHPVNRALHLFGIPMIVVSLPLAFWSWRWALTLFILGWVFQFIGHAVEGKAPAFFSNPLYLFVGVYWWLKKALRF